MDTDNKARAQLIATAPSPVLPTTHSTLLQHIPVLSIIQLYHVSVCKHLWPEPSTPVDSVCNVSAEKYCVMHFYTVL